jgi:predicted nucleic acid-binding protein
MKRLVVDASVAIKWFVPEIHSDAAARLLDPGVLLSAPDLIGPEFANTLWKKVRRQELTADDAAEILKACSALGVVIHPSGQFLPAALELAIALDRTVYDSLYLALAVAQDAALVTADAKFHAAVARSALAAHILWIDAVPAAF